MSQVSSGDMTDVNAQQVVIAIGEGANAALSAYNYLLFWVHYTPPPPVQLELFCLVEK